MRVFGMGLALAMGLSASMATAKTPLSEVGPINQGLLTVGIADEIRNKCDDIEPRMVRAVVYLQSLISEAKALGYTQSELEAFRSSKSEQRRLRKEGEAILVSKGFKASDPDSLCKVGRAEIAKGSEIGKLLRAK